MECEPQLWQSWAETIRDQLASLCGHQSLFHKTISAISKQPNEVPAGAPATWYRHYLSLYADRQVIALRRVIVSTQGSVSLERLLRSMAKHPREARESGYDAAVVGRDLSRLLERVDTLKAWADKVVAHVDPLKPATIPNFGDIDTAIQDACSTFYRYEFGLTGQTTLLEDPATPPGQEQLADELMRAFGRFRVISPGPPA